jgi:hypothetical protein
VKACGSLWTGFLICDLIEIFYSCIFRLEIVKKSTYHWKQKFLRPKDCAAYLKLLSPQTMMTATKIL